MDFLKVYYVIKKNFEKKSILSFNQNFKNLCNSEYKKSFLNLVFLYLELH